MNLRNWSKQHSLGVVIGLISPLIFLPLIFFVISQSQGVYMEALWFKFKVFSAVKAKMVSLAIIPNLAWFYLTLNKQKYNLAMGIILGSALYLPYIIYVTMF
jgi:hypothetical protein